MGVCVCKVMIHIMWAKNRLSLNSQRDSKPFLVASDNYWSCETVTSKHPRESEMLLTLITLQSTATHQLEYEYVASVI